MRNIWQRLAALFRGRRLDRELSEELEIHLAMQAEEFRGQGMEPTAARAAALREFGGVLQTQEAYRERRGVAWLESTAKDVRYALRGLRRNPGFTAAAVISLALGIGANTAIFSLFHTLMMRMLPVARPQELVTLYKTGGWGQGYTSYPLYLELAERSDLFNSVAARTGVAKVRFTLAGGQAQFTQREFVSGNYFDVLGVGPALGRLFNDDDNRVPGRHPLAVLSYDFWRNRFGADPGVLGRTLLVDEQLLTVIGVAAPGFRGVEVEHHPEIWVPAMMYPAKIMNPGMWWVWILGRRRPEVSLPQLQAAVDVLVRQHLAAAYPTSYNAAFRKKALEQRLQAREGDVGLSVLRDEFGKPLAVLMAAVGLVLLAACVNVANLTLARGAARQREIALRFSLGATRARLVRQALTESLLLAAAGSCLGVAFAWWGQATILRFLPADSGDALAAGPNATVLWFTLAVSAISALLFGLAPALRSTAVRPATRFRWGARLSQRGAALRRGLVVAQVAFSVVLVVLAALFGHSLLVLRSVDLGFHNQNVFAFSFDFPRNWKGEMRPVRERLLTQMKLLPGVASVSYGFPGPYQMGTSDASIRVPGSRRTASEPANVDVQYIGPRFFETIGSIPLSGREFDRNDTDVSPKVAVVNRAFVREFFSGDAHPLGRAFSFDDSQPDGGERTLIVGVVGDIRHNGLRANIDPTVYVPFVQKDPSWPPVILVRSQLAERALLAAAYGELSRLGPAAAVWQPQTLDRHIEDSIFRERLLAMLGGFFGGLALLLAAVGLYGVVAYGTAQRAAEFGVRIALGAPTGQVLWMVLRDALALVALGLAIGLPASLAAARAVGSLLFDVKPEDPLTFVTTASVLAVIGLAAAWVPAWKAARDSMRALRHE
jgi:predicted permease